MAVGVENHLEGVKGLVLPPSPQIPPLHWVTMVAPTPLRSDDFHVTWGTTRWALGLVLPHPL